MKRLLCIAFVILLMGCATMQKAEKDVIDMKLTQRVVTTCATNDDGNMVCTQDTLVPAVPFNFWSTLLKVGIGAAKKAGGI